MKHYIIFGWVTCDIAVELGEIDTKETLHDIWDIITQVFDDGTCKEGIFAKEAKR